MSEKVANDSAKPVDLPEDVLATFEEKEGRQMSGEEMQIAARKLTMDRKKEVLLLHGSTLPYHCLCLTHPHHAKPSSYDAHMPVEPACS